MDRPMLACAALFLHLMLQSPPTAPTDDRTLAERPVSRIDSIRLALKIPAVPSSSTVTESHTSCSWTAAPRVARSKRPAYASWRNERWSSRG